MSNILKKECKLSASILSYIFIAFGLMFLLPGYPVLCGPFFVCLGIYQSFQNAREANDMVFSALLPIAKKDIVKGKFALGMAFTIFGSFNLIFVRGFFKTAYKFGKPFVYYTVVNFIIIGCAETLHHIPGFSVVNSFGFENFGLLLGFLVMGIFVYAVMTLVAFKCSSWFRDKD